MTAWIVNTAKGENNGISVKLTLLQLMNLTGRVLEVIFSVEDLNHFLVLALDHGEVNICQQVSSVAQHKAKYCHLPRSRA